jgi:diaminopimelate epimerase
MDTEISIYLGSSCGNTFVIADLRSKGLKRAEKISFAVQATAQYAVDSCLFIQKSEVADIEMEIFEQDGTQSNTCGNGMLLITHFLEINDGRIETKGGIFKVHCDNERVSVLLGVRSVKVAGFPHDTNFLYIQSGEPHIVSLVENINDIDLIQKGSELQKHFKGGVNVNLLESVDGRTYKIKTFERGVLNITKSCGTGSLSSYTATSFINGELNTGVLEFKSSGGSHWVSRVDGDLQLQTLRKFCVINFLHNLENNGL